METSTTRIPPAQVETNSASFADPRGRVFWWRGGLYRGIGHEHVEFVKRLFEGGVVQNLIGKGFLVETELTDLALDGYGLVLRHRTVPVVSYCYEWCFEMLKDAALLIVDLELELAGYGLTLQDAHPWNVLFDGSRPLWVDFGSICLNGPQVSWGAYDEFSRFLLHPLYIMGHGHGRVARWLLHDMYRGIQKSEFTALTHTRGLRAETRDGLKRVFAAARQRVPSPLHYLRRKGAGVFGVAESRSRSNEPRLAFMKRLRREVAGIAVPSRPAATSEPHADCSPSLAASEGWAEKNRIIHELLRNLHPGSVLDIGSGRGWYSRLAALLGNRVVAVDVDEWSVAQLYQDVKGAKFAIVPLLMDFGSPSPGYGLSDRDGAPAVSRLKCAMVLALGLVDQLVFRDRLTFEQISEGLAAFAERWLVVEFISEEHRSVDHSGAGTYPWYRLENLLDSLRAHFQSVKICSSEVETQVLLLCEK